MPDSYAALSLQTQTAYAELLERLLGDAGGGKPGTIVRKRVGSGTYLYVQHKGPLGARQTYLGPESEKLRERVEEMTRTWAEARERAESREDLVAAVRAGRAAAPTAAEAKLFGALADAGLFRAGAVLVGTHAFAVLGNVLGVRWSSLSVRTDDIDLAQDANVSVALAAEITPADLGKLTRERESGGALWPIPAFDHRSASTSFRVHGTELRVDLLTPLRGRSRVGPVRLPALGGSATPLRFLDFVLEETIPAAIAGAAGVLVNVPVPARFALHKLIVAQERPAHQAAKAAKDLAQAQALIDVIGDQRPADLRDAWKTLVARGEGWRGRAQRSLRRIDRTLDGAT